METIAHIINTVKSSQLLDEANATLLKGQYYEAMHLFNTYLLFDPENKDARLKKGLCYLYTEQFEKAYQLFEQLNAEGPDAETSYCYAEYYKLVFDFDYALTYITQAIRLDEENATYHRLAAELCYLNQDYDEAFSLINRAIVLSPFREELYYWRALIFLRFEKHQVSLHDLNRAISINPQFAEAYRLRANIRMRLGEVEPALQDLKNAQRFELLLAEQVKHAA